MLKTISISQDCVAKMIGLEGLISSERVLCGSSSPVQMATFLPQIILLNVRCYCHYALSYRNLEEMMARGIEIDRATIHRWVLSCVPQLDKRLRPHLKQTNDSWRVNETYIKVTGEGKYLYRAVDSDGNTLDFMLAQSETRQQPALFRKVLKAYHTQPPRVIRVITVDKNASYPVAIKTLKDDETLEAQTQLRHSKYLNNMIEQISEPSNEL